MSGLSKYKYIKINNLDNILYLFCFFVCIRPDYMSYNNFIVHIWSLGQSFLPLIVLYFVLKYRELRNVGVWLLLTVYIWFGISTLFNGGDFSCFIEDIDRPITALFVTYYGIKYDEKNFLKTVLILLIGYTLINLGVMIVHPNGLKLVTSIQTFNNGESEKVFFFGKNTAIKNTLLALFFMSLYQLRFEGQIGYKTKILGVIVLIESVIAGSGTSSMISIFIVIALIVGLERLPHIVNILTAWILNIAFFIGIIVLQVQAKFEYFIVNILHKDLTFTGRLPLWMNGLVLVLLKPIIGYGSEAKLITAFKLGVSNDSMHNFILDSLYQGGIIIIMLWTLVLVYLTIVCSSIKDIQIRNTCKMFIFAMMIGWMSEPFTKARIFTTIVMFATVLVYQQKDRSMLVKHNDEKEI